jgi:lipopolysaccharide export system permease protein
MVVQEGLREGYPAGVMLRIMPYTLPIMLGITLPASMLFAVCSVFGRMTGGNEIVALKSLGINPMVVVWPAIVLAAFLSLGTVWMYEIAATWCKPTVLRIGIESIEEIALSKLQKDHSCDRAQFPLSIIVKRVDKPAEPGSPPRLVEPTITIKGPPKVTISAEEATLRTDWDQRKLQIECTRGEFDFGGPRMSFFGKERFTVPIPDPNMAQYRYHRDWVSMREIPKLIEERQNTIDQQWAEIRGLEQLQAANQALGSPKTGDTAGEIAGRKANIDRCQFDIRRLRAETYRRWANGFTCLCFALLGIPVAMYWRHADVLTNFFVCFLPILAIYYPLLMLSDDLSTSGKLPPFSFWTANVILTIPAVALLRLTVKH